MYINGRTAAHIVISVAHSRRPIRLGTHASDKLLTCQEQLSDPKAFFPPLLLSLQIVVVENEFRNQKALLVILYMYIFDVSNKNNDRHTRAQANIHRHWYTHTHTCTHTTQRASTQAEHSTV